MDQLAGPFFDFGHVKIETRFRLRYIMGHSMLRPVTNALRHHINAALLYERKFTHESI